MKVAILAGGAGTRLAEETAVRPKPMVEIGGRPILLHIMQLYAHHGFKDFAVALGYRGNDIKRYMMDLYQLSGSLHIDYAERGIHQDDLQHHDLAGMDQWRVDLVDTGASTQTGGRIKRLAPYLKQSTFMLTYGDGLSNVDVRALLRFHREHGRLATVTAVRPTARFGLLQMDGDRVTSFREKKASDEGWINGGFFILEPEVLDYIEGDESIWEREPLEALARDRQLVAYRHDDFWQCMDTLREKQILQELWDQGDPPWRVWGKRCESY
ncbi:MAG: glucose-1-phosphate cytidylyltransferase [Chloroflexota bacterium]